MSQAGRLLTVAALALVLRVVSAPSPSAQTAPATAAISGVVSDAATGRPIAGAVVSLRVYGPPGARTGQQITDARGRFVFDELVASKQYILDASKPGYVDGHYGQLPGQPLSNRFALADGQWLSTANIELTRVGAIGGVVTDEFGEPVVGAFVRALTEITVAGRPGLAAGPTAKTDDRGEYRLTGLLAARYVIMLPSIQNSVPANTTPAQAEGLGEEMYARFQTALARNPAMPHLNNGAVGDGNTRLIIGNFAIPPAPVDGHDRAYPMMFFPGTTSISAATAIALSDGEEKSGINVSLQPVTAVRVSGRVEGMMTPSRLLLRLVAAGLEELGAGGEAATTLVNPDGTFTFLSVPAGSYTIDPRQSTFQFLNEAVYVPYTPSLPETPGQERVGGQIMGAVADSTPATGYSLRYGPGPAYFGRTPLTVGSADVSNVVVVLQPEVTMRGRFVYEDMPNGPPQRANAVFAQPAGGNWGLGLVMSVNEGPDGDPRLFTMRGIGPGTYVVRPTPPQGAVVRSIVIDGEDHLTKPIEATAGHDFDAVITFTGKVPRLSGVVRNSQGLAPDRATVIAFSTDRTTWPDLGLSPLVAKLAATLADGTFTLSTLPAGEYYVVAIDGSHTAGWTDPGFLAKAAAVATRVSLEWGGAKSVDLRLVTVK